MAAAEIAKILYAMSIDMDYLDYAELWQQEIDLMAAELEQIKKQAPCLLQALEMIAEQNAAEAAIIENLLIK